MDKRCRGLSSLTLLFLYVLYPTVYYGDADKIKHEFHLLSPAKVTREETFGEYLKLLDKGDFEHIKTYVRNSKYWRTGK